MHNVVFSIKPPFVEKIFIGKKRYEYRKTVLRKVDVKKIIIYATKPLCCVVGEAEIKSILVNNPNVVWKETQNYSGIEKDFYDKYFAGSKKAVAYELCNVLIYARPKTLKEIGLSYVPQSFAYIEIIDK